MSQTTVQDIYPLSPMQQGMLFHTVFEEGSEAYFEQVRMTLTGALDAAAFRTAWQRVVDRHPVLRSGFYWKRRDEPFQVVQARVELPWEDVDWRQVAPESRPARLAALAAADRARGFTLDQPPLLRIILVRLADELWHLIWSHHHIVLDGWCRPIVVGEALAFYDALRHGRALTLAPARPYRDYIAWLKRQDPALAEAFWRRTLAGFSAPTPLPVDQPAAAAAGTWPRHEQRELHLPAAALAALQQLARRRQLTLSAIAQSLWGLLLARLSGRHDVVFGAVVSGRPAELPGVESMVGLFINTLPVRVRIDPAAAALAWIEEQMALQLELRRFEHSALSEVRRWSGVPAGQPLFESLVVFQNLSAAAAGSGPAGLGLAVSEASVAESADHPLILVVEPEQELVLRCEYDARRFSPATLGRLLGQLGQLLSALPAAAAGRLDALPHLSAAERHQLVAEWNATERPPPQRELMSLWAERLARSPGAPAALSAAESVTYRELDRRANRLANHLLALGAVPDRPVGLAVPRSVDTAVALLAILKAGAAYVPLDPAYPAARLRRMVEQAGAELVVGEGAPPAALAAAATRWVDLRADRAAIAAAADGPPPLLPDPESLAYLIFTSGSTGQPKGVAMAHRALAHYAQEMARQLGLRASDRFLQFASLSFDVLLEELLPTWVAGGAVVFHRDDLLGSPAGLQQVIAGHGVTALELPAAFWHEWVRELAEAGELPPPSLRLLVVGAEKPSPERLATWHGFGVPLLYVFGLTETAITSTLHWSSANGGPALDLPIGRPVANTRVYLLDAACRPVALRVPGELYIGGLGLARGYLGRPDLTAERFVPDPFPAAPGARLYRTGDLARYRLDGRLEFLGRVDFQVKIRGFRVEPGEIEEALRHHPEVAAAAVGARPLAGGGGGRGQRLVAWVVPVPGARPAVETLRSFLAARLPEFMVPAAFVTLDRLPLSANGKLDRGALPEPEGERPDLAQGYVAPRSPAEEQLAAIWSRALGLARVGVDDDFFALGGDSILSLQIVAKAQRAGWRITPKLLFEHPTIAGLAAAAAAAEAAGAAAGSAEQGPITGPAPLLPAQHWFFAQGFAEPHWFNLPLLLDLGELGSPGLAERVLAGLAAHHDALRVRIEPWNGGRRQVGEAVSEGGCSVPRVDLSAVAAERRGDALGRAAGELQGSFDLAAGPLFKAARFDLGAAGQRLLLLAHHLVMDAVSLRILVEDLVAGCRQLAAGEPLCFVAKTTSWKLWAERVAEHAASPQVRAELGAWTALAGAGIAPLPVERPGGDNREGAAATVVTRLPAAETRALLAEVPRPYRTQLLDALLAALAEAFAEWSGARRLLVELEGHGREEMAGDLDLSRTVGWLTSLYPVVLDLSAAAGPGGGLAAVKEQLRAVPARGFHYGLLRYLGDAETVARLAALPRPEVLFNYLGQLEPEDGELAVRPAVEPSGPSQSPRARRTHRFEINAAVAGGELQVAWTHGGLDRRETVENLAARHLAALRRLIAHCRTPGAGGFTPSDFPLAHLAQAQLDGLVASRGGAAIEDVYPLSPLQEGMLFHALYEPEAGLYVGQLSYRLDGELDESAFGEAWRRVAERHPALRSAFAWRGLDRPLQVVLRRIEPAWAAADWRHLETAEQEARLAAWLAADRERGFDLERAPLERFALLRLGGQARHFVWTHHQIVLDGWSLPLVLADVFACYEALHGGRTPQLPPVRPYRDYIAWLGAQAADPAAAHWRRTLGGIRAATAIEVARPPAAAGGHGERRRLLPPAATGELSRLARAHQLTLSTLAQGAWALLLARYSGAPAVVFGAVVAGRPAELPGVERMVGLFINTLPVRADVEPRARVLPWLKRLQEAQLESVRYEWSALSTVQRSSAVPAGQPLFTTILAFQNQPSDEALAGRSPGFTASRGRTAERTNYPLTVVAEPGRALALMIEHDRGRFDDAAVERMLGHLAGLLAALAGGPHLRLGELPLLAAWEREQVLRQWQGEAAARPAVTLGARLRAAAAARPQGLAVVCGERHLSYGELWSRGQRLGGLLRAAGAGAEAVVGLCAERSLELAVGMWGALSAGAAYLPLDPEFPGERLAWMLADAGSRVVLATAAASRRLGEALAAGGRRLLPLDGGPCGGAADWMAPRGLEEVMARPGLADSLAYVIYTSGSTGRPKGVGVAQGAVAAYGEEMVRCLGLTAVDRVLQFAALSFDVVVEEVVPAWLAGGVVVLREGEGVPSVAELEHLLAREAVTWLELPAAYWQQWVWELEQSQGRPGAGLRLVVVGSERPSAERVRRWAEWGVALVYIFGLTETTVTSSLHRLVEADREWGHELPIGRPVANSRMYVLDGWGEALPVGVVGELYVGGPGVARGYMGDPAQTAARFVPDPMEGAGGRLYRTGDLVRWRGDGSLEFLGRRDAQVKVRGFRVEPGEVEEALRRHPGVRDAAVVARPSVAGGRRLVAYVVQAAAAAGGAAAPPEELRAFLRQRLPEFMVPARCVVLDALPLSPNGKVDRLALPDPELAAGEPAGVFAAPRSEVERRLAAIWGEVLGRERVGIHDDFFALGGDSILSLQIVSRAHRGGIRITPRQLFEHPTVAALAAISAGDPLAAGAALADQAPLLGAVPLLPIQRWFFEQDLADPHWYNQSALLSTRRRLDPALLARAAALLFVHHDALRLRYTRAGAGWSQSCAAAGEPAPLSVLDLCVLPAALLDAAVERAAEALQGSLDLARGPVVRLALLDLGAVRSGRLLAVFHHLVVDEVSWRILLEDLEAVYARLERREMPELPPKTTSVRSWAERLAEHVGSAELAAELPYWLAPRRAAVRPLPLDAAPGNDTVARAATCVVELTAGDTERLLRAALPVYRLQAQEMLLAALALALVRWTGDRLVLLDLEGHGRDEILPGVDLTRTVGWLATLFPLLLDLGDALAPGDVLRAVKEQVRALPRHGIGYGVLRHLAGGEEAARLRRLPAAEILFNYLGQSDALAAGNASRFTAAPEPSGLAVSPRALRHHRIEIAAMVAGGRLRCEWTYGPEVLRPATVEALARGFERALAEIALHCLSPEAGGFTPSDFPLAGLAQQDLDRVIGHDREVEDVYPLSPVQQGMLFHTLFEPGAGMFVGQFGYEVRGALDAARLRAAWQGVLDRHPALRTGVVWQEVVRPLQIVRRRVELAWQQEDWSELTAGEQRARLAAARRDDREHGFELGRPPLVRLRLIRLGLGLHQLVWTFHQMMIDGWSLPLILGEVGERYAAALAGRVPALPPAPAFGAYIGWLERRGLGEAEAFWRRELAGFAAPTPLAIEAPRRSPALADAHRESQAWVPPALSAELGALARAHRLTLNTLIQGVWGLALARYSGQLDVVFGVTVAGRPPALPGIEEMVGMFLNTLPLRLHVRSEAGWVSWLHEAQERQAESRQHEHTPLAEIQRWSELPAGAHLFESYVVFQNYPVEEALAEGGGLAVGDAGIEERGNYPLGLVVEPGERLAVRVEYDGNRFAAAAIARLQGHLRALLAALAGGPHLRLGELPLLAAWEREQVLRQWQGEAAARPAVTLGARLRAAAAARPQGLAVVCGERHLSYGELWSRGQRLGGLLRAAGAGAEAVVGLCAERSLELAVGMWGALSAGAAYLPLDPEFPGERLAWMLADAGSRVVLATAAASRRLGEALAAGGRRLLPLDGGPCGGAADWMAPRGLEEVMARPGLADSLAYVIYTSGSTGRPKGVGVAQGAVAAYGEEMVRCLGLTAVDRVLQFAALSFDVVVEEVVPAWLAGGVVVLREGEGVPSVAELEHLLAREAVTWLELPAAYWQQWVWELEQSQGRPGAGLRLVVVGSERPSAERVRRWSEWGVALVYIFGLTETTVTSSLHRLVEADREWGHELPIGRPVANSRMYVLDGWGEALPVGVVGELYVGGPGVARGYMGDPAQTAARFVPDPMEGAGGRLYRTGDLVRWRGDGSLEFLGRRDAQVKVRGFRVEPGEVEEALRRHPGVRDAAVAVRGGRLVGYVVPAAGGAAAPAAPRFWPSHGEYPIYDDLLYFAMARDEERNQRYRAAIAAAVPGKVVVDLGTGADALLARFCAEAGAARVYAIEAMADSAQRAAATIARLGLGETIRLVGGWSTTVELPELADVCISELIGCIGGAEGAAVLLGDARRLLKADGRMIPSRCLTRVAGVELPPGLLAEPAFTELGARYAEQVFAAVGRKFDLRLCIEGFPAAQLLTEPGLFEELDFRQAIAPDYERALDLAVTRGGRLDGFLLWIELDPGAGDPLDSLRHRCSWLPLYLPAFAAGAAVAAGDRVRLGASARLSDDGVHPDYRLWGTVRRAAGAEAPFAMDSTHHGEAAGSHPLYTQLYHGASIRVGRHEGTAAVASGESLRQFLLAALPEHMVPGLWVRLAALPVSPHGKLDRAALPEPEQVDGAAAAAHAPPRTALERRLAEIWQEVLGIGRVGIDDDFFALGGDSILSLQIVARAHRAGIELTPRQLFEQPTIARLAAVAGRSGGIVAEQGAVSGRVPLLPIQHWFFAQGFRSPQWFNEPLLLAVAERIAPPLAGRVLGAVLAHHDALRLRFFVEDGEWVQQIDPPGPPPVVPRVDLAALPAPCRPAAIEEVGTAVQSSLDLGRGPLARLVSIELGRELPGRLLFVLHHLVMDEASLGWILEDLETALRAARRGEPVRLPAKTSSYKAWAERLAAHARSAALAAEVPYWTAPPRGELRPLPVTVPEGDNDEASARVAWAELDPEHTAALLREVPKAYRMGVQEVLLAALAWTLRRWTGDGLVQVDLEGAGREAQFAELDVSRTVGWCTAIFPLLLDLRGAGDAGAVLRAVKQQVRAVPGGGLGYGLLRYLRRDEAVCALPPSQVLFNYGGVEDGPAAARTSGGRAGGIAPAAESAGPDLAPWEKRTHLLEVDGAVRGGRLRFAWTYSRNLYPDGTVERLARGFEQALAELARHCLSPEAGGFTPEDFPLAGLTQADLDRVVGRDREVEDVYPLSPVQQGMLFHTVFEPGAGMYVGQLSYELHGAIDRTALVAAWQRVTDRHSSLRTSMVWRETDRPLQVVWRRVVPPWTFDDLSGLSAAAQAERLARFLALDRERGFAISQAPLLRLALFRLAPARHLLVWSFHQMAFDGWSLPIVLNEVTLLYPGLAGGRAAALPEARPYRDYIAWLGRLDTAAGEAFWRRALAGLTRPTALPYDHPAGAAGGHAEQRSQLTAADRARLAAAARSHRLTQSTLAHAAWGLVLAACGAEDEVVFGTTVAGRPADLPGVEEMVGLFLNTLPVRLDTSPHQPLLPWLAALQARQMEMLRHEHTPLFEIQRWSAVGSGQALFDSVLVFENYPQVEEGSGGIAGLMAGATNIAEQANFPVVLSVEAADLLLLLNHDAGRLDGDSARRLLARFALALASLPGLLAGGRLGDVPVLSPAEAHQLRVEWNDTAESGAGGRPVHLLFEEQVERSPQALAVECAAAAWTYAELNQRANRIARHLRRLGAGPGTRVGVWLARSPELAAALLGVLKAGAVYLPLDPGHPPRRLALLLADSGAALLLSEERRAAALPPHGARLVALDTVGAALAAEGGENLAPSAGDGDLAYLIYTSGSTGRPKAVMIEHGSLAHTLLASRRRFAFRATDRMLHLAPFAFDISLFELFNPLLAGGAVHLLTGDEILEPRALLAALELASLVHTVPSLMRRLLAHLAAIGRLGAGGAGLGLRGLFIGGDAVAPELLAGMRQAFPGAWIEVLYGPTEATIICSSHAAAGGAAAPAAAGGEEECQLIGRPLPGVSLRLLDRHGRPVPIGVAGEIHVGGRGVARGYLGREELTRERFVSLDGERCYRTGDLGRTTRRGVVEFLGRTDLQVKVHGFRVELGEIEARLAAHPGVREVAVAARQEGGETRLVAYVVPAAAGAPAVSELRRFLQQALPAHMVPGDFVPLEALPLTATGKLDRQALPAPGAGRPDLAVSFAAPEDALESRLAAIWAEVLGRERVGRHDNFFDLGGDSILSLQISSRAHRAGLQVSPKQIFLRPTIAELAVAVREAAAIAAEQQPVVGPVPLTPIQHRFFAAEPVEPHHFNLPLLLTTRARIEPGLAARVVAAVVAHHDALRAGFVRGDGGWRQSFAPPGGPPPVWVCDLGRLPTARRAGALEAAADGIGRSLDIAHGPLLRLALFDLGAGVPGRLLLVVHHLVSDEVSRQVLLEDLEAAFDQARLGQPIALPLKTTSVRAWAERLAERRSSPELLAEAAYWLAAERDMVAPLPVDDPDGSNLDGAAKWVEVALPAAVTGDLLREVPRLHRTEAREAILAAAVLALARWSGRQLLLVDLEGHGREELFADVNLSRTVGWFAAIYPVLFDLRGSLAPGDAVREVRERLRAVPGGGLGYGLLRYASGLEETARRLRGQPPAEVIFNYRGQEAGTAGGGDAGAGAGAGAAPAVSVFGLAPESPGRDVSPRARRAYLLEIDGGVEGGELRFTWSYSPHRHRRATIERLAEDFIAALAAVVAHCLSPAAQEPPRASDFPLAGLDDGKLQQLGQLIAEIDRFAD